MVLRIELDKIKFKDWFSWLSNVQCLVCLDWVAVKCYLALFYVFPLIKCDLELVGIVFINIICRWLTIDLIMNFIIKIHEQLFWINLITENKSKRFQFSLSTNSNRRQQRMKERQMSKQPKNIAVYAIWSKAPASQRKNLESLGNTNCSPMPRNQFAC